MTNRTPMFIAALSLIILPSMMAAGEAVWYHRWIAENRAIVSSGVERTFHLYVPPGYDAAEPAALVFSMHGAGMRAVSQMHTSQWNRIADRHGFIVVYPSALQGSGPPVWDFTREQGTIRDVQFIRDLIANVSASYNIDRRRIYANGLSNGAGMAFALSCEMSDSIAAVGLVGTAFTVPWEWCTDMRPVPMIAFHGTEDTATPYHGGRTWIAPPGMSFPDIPSYVDKWARRNLCAGTPLDTRIADDVTRRSYGACANDADVLLYTVHGGGHTWPGGGPLPEWFVGTTARSIDATELMSEFFFGHSLQ